MPVRYAYALTAALLLGGTAASMTLAAPNGQTAQNEPGAIQATAPRPGAPMSFADMVAKLSPAVVNISTKQKVTLQQQQNPFGGLFGQFFGFPPDQDGGNGQGGGGGGAPITREAQSLGSGFVISPDGYIVTNNHVIAAGAKGATVESITVTLADRKEYTAKLIGHDEASDLALLKIDAGSALPFVKWGDSAHSRVGDWVIAIGEPFGLGGTVTAGIISALNRVTGQPGPFDRFIQTDAAINQGNSGGPMFDMQGNVIGINSQIYSQSGGNIGIGFAIPAEYARPVIDKLMKGEKITRGYLGVGIQPVSDDLASAWGLQKNQGEIISRVEPDGPAAKAGFKPGDVVMRVNGKDVTPDQTLSGLIADVAPGNAAKVDILRDGKPMSLNVTVGTRPSEEALQAQVNGDDDNDGLPDDNDDQDQAAPAPNPLGLQAVPLTPAIARAQRIDPGVHGLIIATVDPASDAAAKGLKRGDVIVSANRTPVATVAQLNAAVAQAKAQGRDAIALFVQRGPNGIFIAVKFKK
jgi:serine protease Do